MQVELIRFRKKISHFIYSRLLLRTEKNSTRLACLRLDSRYSPVPEGGSVCVACTRSFASDHS